MSKSTNISCNFKFVKSRSIYKIRLQAYRRYQKPLYKIVITNSNNRIVATLGYYNPFKIKFRQTYKNLQHSNFTAKVVAINRLNTISWLRQGVVPSSAFLYFLLDDMGLLKTQSSVVFHKFVNFNTRAHRLSTFFVDELLNY
jgi:ribosomal protein S16